MITGFFVEDQEGHRRLNDEFRRFREDGYGLPPDNLRAIGDKDVIVANYGSAGTVAINNILAELGLNYVASNIATLHADGTSSATESYTERWQQLITTRQAATTLWPRFTKTHLPHEYFSSKRLGGVWIVVRDPRDALYSLYRILHQQDDPATDPYETWNHSFDDWINDNSVLNRRPVDMWVEFYSSWLERAGYQDELTITRFEDFKRNPAQTIGAALERFGVKVTRQQLDAAASASSFAAMQTHESAVSTGAQVIRRGMINEWREWMDDEKWRAFSGDDLRELAGKLGYDLTFTSDLSHS
ncbi:sulfotransferase domain-containing protein [Amycolatopsis sp. GM8]|uniref:sulfotransferase domain-containing protein n=1 Tax=Amycolatopsis sp. GM8 TaxID=2896530 RepID=UPI001F443154|nr:sulfotransferase domain-containing protein [Amycolatopsis sp. GM8]